VKVVSVFRLEADAGDAFSPSTPPAGRSMAALMHS